MSFSHTLSRHSARSLVLLGTGLALGVAALTFIAGRTSAAANTAAPSPLIRFTAEAITLRDAAENASKALGVPVILGIEASHPAHRRTVSLKMTTDEPDDVLNAVSCAFGLRWLWTGDHTKVRLVDKEHYRGSAEGLRHALADGLPVELRYAVDSPAEGRHRRIEDPLRPLEMEPNAARLEKATEKGPGTLDRLEPEDARVLLHYLNSICAFYLGEGCSRFESEYYSNRRCEFHYGTNVKGTKQFSFKIGNGWVACKPD